MSKEIFFAILSGGVMVAIIEGIREYLAWRRNRKAVKEDRMEEKAEAEEMQNALNADSRLKTVEDKIDALVKSQKFIMYDRIRYLGQAYINEKEIDFDDRRILNDMHNSYHNGLGGNGDLDILMEEVNHLPLKTNK